MPTSKPLRPGWRRAAPSRSSSTRSAAGTSRRDRAAAILRADPTELAAGWAARLEKEPSEPAPERVDRRREAAAAGRARRASWAARMRPPTDAPTARSQSRRCTAPSGAAHADGDLVYTASSMPIRDQEAFLGAGDADVLFLCNRGANGIDGLISSGIGAAHASGRPTTIVTGDLGLLHDIGGLAALRDVSTPVRIVVIDNDGGGIFHFLPQERGAGRRGVRGPARHSARRRRRQGRRPLRPPPPPPRVARRPPRRAGRRHRPDRGQIDRHQRRPTAASERVQPPSPSTARPADPRRNLRAAARGPGPCSRPTRPAAAAAPAA